MSTKLRSACDRCHETKVRCSGNMPCQGCLLSRNLCFYSVSQPLGRPKGTKKKHNRNEPAAVDAWPRPGGPHENNPEMQSGTSGHRGPGKRNKTRQRLSDAQEMNDCYDMTALQNPVASTLGERMGPTRLSNGDSIVRESSSSMEEVGDIAMSDAVGSNGFHHGSQSPIEHETSEFELFLPEVLGFDELDKCSLPALTRSEFSYSTLSDMPRSVSWQEIFTANKEGGPEVNGSRKSSLSASRIPKELLASRPQICDNILQSSDYINGNDMSSQSMLFQPAKIQSVHVPNTTDMGIMPSRPASDVVQHVRPCVCLQKHAEVLSNPILSETRAVSDSNGADSSIDKALSLVEHAMKAWQGLLNCPDCPYSNDHEAILLAFMSLRSVIRYLQRLSPRYSNTSRNNTLLADSQTSQHATGDTRLRIGNFEVEGSDRAQVLMLLYQNTLTKVSKTLQSLQLIQDRKKQRLLENTQNKAASADDYQASSNLFHIQQMSYGLTSVLQAMEASVDAK